MIAIKDRKVITGCHPEKFGAYIWNTYTLDNFKLASLL
jgi:hypothetical protein